MTNIRTSEELLSSIKILISDAEKTLHSSSGDVSDIEGKKQESIIQNSLLGALAGLGLRASAWRLSCGFVWPLSRIVAFGSPDVASEAHLERPLSRIVAFDSPDVFPMSLPRFIWSDPCRGSWLSALRMSLRRRIWSDPYRGSWLSIPRMSSGCRFRGSFGVIPVEGRGFRPSGCRF